MKTRDIIKSMLLEFAPLYRFVPRPLWRCIKTGLGQSRGLSPDGYWLERCDMNYYREVVRLSRIYAEGARQVLDVGSNETEIVKALTWIPEKAMLDVRPLPSIEGVTTIQSDFLEFQSDRFYDLVLCLQVLEHLDDPSPFVSKLFSTGERVIISVPYKWPQGAVPDHVQDPVTWRKFRNWTRSRQTLESRIVFDRWDRRLVVVF